MSKSTSFTDECSAAYAATSDKGIADGSSAAARYQIRGARKARPEENASSCRRGATLVDGPRCVVQVVAKHDGCRRKLAVLDPRSKAAAFDEARELGFRGVGDARRGAHDVDALALAILRDFE